MEKYFQILRKCPLFCHISQQDLSAMLTCLRAKVSVFRKGETVIPENAPARDLGIILSGAVQIAQNDYFGNRTIVARIGPAGLFGESFACAGVPAVPVAVTACEPAEVMFVDCARITRTCTGACRFHQQLLYNLLKVMARKNLMFHQKIEITSKRTTREKLLAYLFWQARENRSDSFEIPYTRQELADYLQVDRSGLSAEIGKLCQQGLLETDRRKFRLIRSDHIS